MSSGADSSNDQILEQGMFRHVISDKPLGLSLNTNLCIYLEKFEQAHKEA
jgi:hypothetical protein